MNEEYIETTFDKVIRWVKYDAKYLHLDIIRGVKNLIRWFPTIWKDRDYDHSYIYEVLRVKLENQATYISHKDRHTSAQRDAELMMLAARLITIQQEDLYDMEYLDYHESNFKWIDATDGDSIPEKYKGSKRLEIEIVSERFDEYFERYPRQYKRAVSGELNLFTRNEDEKENKKIYAMEIAHENQRRSRKLLFKLLDDRINGWWD
jgi:hypothetical protein